MVHNDSIRISAKEKAQQAVMKTVLLKLQDTPYVLKGGAALIFTRGSERHTTDLDFDSAKQLNIKTRLKAGLEQAGVEIVSLKPVKNTETVQRFKVHYRDIQTGDNVLFKVETSFRTEPDPKSIEQVNGIRTYNVVEIFEQKFLAAQARTKARDLFDVTYLLNHYGTLLSGEQIERVSLFSEDLDGLVDRYGKSFSLDQTLIERTTIDDTVLTLREVVENAIQQRLEIVQQHNPRALANDCFECLKITGTSKLGGREVEGDRYIFRLYDQTISITAKDGRGQIFEYSKQRHQSKLTADDIRILNKLPQMNSRLRQNTQSKDRQNRRSH